MRIGASLCTPEEGAATAPLVRSWSRSSHAGGDGRDGRPPTKSLTVYDASCTIGTHPIRAGKGAPNTNPWQLESSLARRVAIFTVIVCGVIALAIWLLGALLKSVGKKRIELAFNAAVERIPLVNVLYRPVAQVVEMLQRDPADKLQGMSVVYCAFGGEGGAGFLGLLVSDQLYRFNGQACQIVYVPTSPVPMSGAVVFAAADSVHRVDMQVDDLMKICLSIGVMSSKVIPDQYVVMTEEVESVKDRLNDIHSVKNTVHAKPAAVGPVESDRK